jgi:EAL domain-containing protein (putative c-di-GMP-specific phosphodiesterase class I)
MTELAPVQDGVLDPILGDPWVTWLLETARERVGSDVAFLSDFTETEQRILAVSGDLDAVAIAAGTESPIEGSFCVRVLAGLIPPVVTAAARNPFTRDLAGTTGGIRSYVGAPIRSAAGRALGMLCCLGSGDDARLDAESARFVEFLAELVGQRLTLLDEEAARSRVAAVLTDGAVRPVFQPIVEIATGRRVGYEALTRFDCADTTTVFTEAALSGRGVELERLALQATLDALDRHPQDVPVALNLSPEALLTPAVLDLLLTPRRQVIGVEITEHRPVEDYGPLLKVRQRLRRAGVPVSVDDAGAGYASLRHVLRLQPDIIKIDAAIVSGVHTDTAKQALVAALVTFADDTGADVVAEGVEHRAESDLLAARGVHLGQGWLYGRPEPLEA